MFRFSLLNEYLRRQILNPHQRKTIPSRENTTTITEESNSLGSVKFAIPLPTKTNIRKPDHADIAKLKTTPSARGGR
jgi:hypothetical protein